MTRQLTSAVSHKLLRSPHAKRPPHGRLRSSRLIGNLGNRTDSSVLQAVRPSLIDNQISLLREPDLLSI